MKLTKKITALCISGTFLLAAMTGCGTSSTPTASPTATAATVAPATVAPATVAPATVAPATVAPATVAPATVAPASATPASTVSADNPIVYRVVGSNIATLSPHQYTADPVRQVLALTADSLYRIVYDDGIDNLKFMPTLAADFPTTTDNKVWTIKVKDGLKFTNGNPINAETLAYSWKMLLDPVLASPQANTIYSSLPIKNAQAYFLKMSEADFDKKKADPNADWAKNEPSATPVKWEDVGIKALDKNTLLITLTVESTKTLVTYNFVDGKAGLSPVDPDMYEKCFNADKTENTYGTTLDKLAQSGPYTLTSWVKDQYRVYEKSQSWSGGKDIYTPDVIEEREVPDANTVAQLFQNGELDAYTPAGTNATKYLDDPRSLKTEGPVVWGFYINGLSETNPILKDRDFRYAIFYATDRATLAKDIYKVYIPADYVISRRAIVGDILSGAQRYRDTPAGKANEAPNNGFDTAKGLELFNKAYAANGNKKVSIQMTYFDTSDAQKKTAEFLKESYEKLFGADRFELTIQAMPYEPAYESYKQRKHDMGFGTLGQDSFNPWSSLDVWSSDSSEKSDTFYNKEYDSLQKRGAAGDLVSKPEERLAALGRMEQLLLDYMPWIPLYQNDGIVLYSDRISIKPTKYITGVAYAPLQAEITNDVPRTLK